MEQGSRKDSFGWRALPGSTAKASRRDRDHDHFRKGSPSPIVIGETSCSLRSRWSGSLDPDDHTVEEPS
jgi:hypothetical protein